MGANEGCTVMLFLMNVTLFCEHYTVQQHLNFHCLYHSDICALVFWDLSMIISACCIVKLIGDDKCMSTDLFKTLNHSETMTDSLN